MKTRHKAKFIIFLTISGLILGSIFSNSNITNYTYEKNSEDFDVESSDDFLKEAKFFGISTNIDDFLEENEALVYILFYLGALVSSELIEIFKNPSATPKVEENDDSALSQEELKALEIIQDHLNRNRVFKKEKIIPSISVELTKCGFNLNNNGIRAILNSLLKKNLIVEGSKLSRETLLLNSNRKKIYDFIKENPGSYLNKLVSALNISIFLVNWHLNVLLKFKLIRGKMIDNFIAYYDYNLDKKNDDLLHVISRKSCDKLVDYLQRNKNGSTKYQISKDLKMHRNTITKYLKKLNEFGLLTSKKVNNKTIYKINLSQSSRLNKIV